MLSTAAGVSDVVFHKAKHLVVHRLPACLAEMDAHHVGGLSDSPYQNRGSLVCGLCSVILLFFVHQIPP